MSLAGQIGLLATRVGQEIKADRTSLALKAPLASPALTGAPTAPTATAGDSSTKIATTAFVAAALGSYLTTASAASTYATIASDNLKAPLASPALTGTPTAPTVASATDSTTKIATTAFVQAATNGLAPIASPTFTGTPRSVNPPGGQNDTMIATTSWVVGAISGKANTNSPAFQGTPTAPTPAAGLNDTQITTTAYVGNAIAAQAANDQNTYAPVASPALTGVPTTSTQSLTTAPSPQIASSAYVDSVSPRMMYPVSVNGGVRLADGSVQVGSPGSFLQANGVFDWSKHKKYRVVWSANGFSNPGTSIYMQFGAGGTVDTGASYAWAATINNNGTLVNAASAASDTSWRVGIGSGETSSVSMSGSFEVLRYDLSARIQGHGIMSKTKPVPAGGFIGADYFPASPGSTSDIRLLVGTGTANIEFRVFGE